MSLPIRFATLGLSLLLAAGAVADDFQQWLTARSLDGDAGETLRMVSFATSKESTLEELAAERNWTTAGTNLSPARPPLAHLEGSTYGSASFNGTDSFLSVHSWSDAGFTDQCSVGLWIKPDLSMFSESRQSRFIVGKSASVEAGYHIGINEKMEITVSIVSANGFATATTGPVIEPYRWHHIGFSWNGESLQIYIDGTAQGSPIPASAPYRDYAAGLLTFGRPAALESSYFRGEIAEFILVGEAYPAQAQP